MGDNPRWQEALVHVHVFMRLANNLHILISNFKDTIWVTDYQIGWCKWVKHWFKSEPCLLWSIWESRCRLWLTGWPTRAVLTNGFLATMQLVQPPTTCKLNHFIQLDGQFCYGKPHWVKFMSFSHHLVPIIIPTKKDDHVTLILKSLQWLPSHWLHLRPCS